MFTIFKNYNPFAIIALFILTVITRLVYIQQSFSPLVMKGQGMWQSLIATFWMPNRAFGYFMFCMLIINIFGQAIMLNWISSKHGLYPKYSYLPAYTYVVLSALLPSWNTWSVFIPLTWLLLILINNLLNLYLRKDAKTAIFNVGFLVSCMAIILFPSLLILLLALVSLAILRPFKLTEWSSMAIGFITPYYIFISLCYLTDSLHLAHHLYHLDFEMISDMSSKKILTGCLLLTILMFSIYYANYFINRMVVEKKKYWNVILIAAFICLGVSITTMHESYAGFSIIIPTVALFGSFIYFEPYKKWIPHLYSFAILFIVLCIQWLTQ